MISDFITSPSDDSDWLSSENNENAKRTTCKERGLPITQQSEDTAQRRGMWTAKNIPTDAQSQHTVPEDERKAALRSVPASSWTLETAPRTWTEKEQSPE